MVSLPPGGPPSFPERADRDPASVLYEDIRVRIGERDFETWFHSTPCVYRPPDRFVLTAPNRFRKAWMEKNYRELLRNVARALFEFDPSIEIRVHEPPGRGVGGECAPRARASEAPANEATPADERRLLLDLDAVPRSGAPAAAGGEGESPPGHEASARLAGVAPLVNATDLNHEFVFENFVPGAPNRVAHAAAIAVSEQPGKTYNPLFIYGDRGVGKTHLLQAICHRLLHQTSLKIAFFTSEAFTSQFVSSLIGSSIDAFRTHCRSADVLVIDDVHFFADKEKTQDELFHTLNTLLSANKQIIVSSVCSPRETMGIQERLVSRFKWGLLTRLDRPDYETRISVLLRKARARHRELPMEVAEFIARHVVDNLREVEGALARVISVASLKQTPLDLETARIALRELIEEEQATGTVTVSQILHAVQAHYHLKSKELLSRSKVRALVHARQMGMYLSRQLTPLSLEEIGGHFGGRDHTTVLYALDRVETLLRTKPQVRGDLLLLKSRIASLRSI